jgi:hypothetical protein
VNNYLLCGKHALGSGLSQELYGKQMGLSQDSISLRLRAARVLESILTTCVVKPDLADRWRNLAEIHAAPRWLWRHLVGSVTIHLLRGFSAIALIVLAGVYGEANLWLLPPLLIGAVVLMRDARRAGCWASRKL